ncbi:MAG TPA: hypothetical protein VMV44_06675 [Rectinemataceae bacterium]|nr:hypothetical protein [Rectinemataceae bacterium]
MRSPTWILALAILASPKLAAIDIGFEARAASLQFPWSQTSETTGTSPWASDISRWFEGGAAWVDMPMGEDFLIHVGYETDPVIRNVVSSLFRFDRGIASVGVGPFVGFLNSDGRLASFGLSTALQVQWPGIAYLSARSDGGLALGLVAGLASVPQTRAELSAGFYTPNAIVSAVLSGKRFSQTDSAGKLIDDDYTRYALVVDIYKKNIPYQLTTTLGYELRSKYWESSALTDSLGSAVIGLKITVEASENLKLYGEFTDAVFTFGMDNLAGRSPATSDVLFSSSLGLVWTLDPADISTWYAGLFKKGKKDSATAGTASDATATGDASTTPAPGTEATTAPPTTIPGPSTAESATTGSATSTTSPP